MNFNSLLSSLFEINCKVGNVLEMLCDEDSSHDINLRKVVKELCDIEHQLLTEFKWVHNEAAKEIEDDDEESYEEFELEDE